MNSSRTLPDELKEQRSQQGTLNKSLTFHMPKISSSSGFKGHKFSGPKLDDGAPYSGIGMDELKLMSPYLHTNWNGKLFRLPESISDKSH